MNMKKLLASALAATMLFTTAVTSFVASAAETVGTITAGDVEKVVGDTDTITADITIDFPDGVVAPHNIITVSIDGYKLTGVALGTVTYAEDSLTTDTVGIDATGTNLEAGKILIECPVDEYRAPTVKTIKLTATFADADDTDTAEGTYDIVVNGDEMTDVNERDITITPVNGTLTVKAAHVCKAGTPVSNENGTHDIPCVGCDKLVADDEPCTYGDDGACTVCGYKKIDANSYVNDVIVTCNVDKQEIKASFAYTAPETKELANYIKGIGGVVTGFGVAITWDDTDPKTSNTGVSAVQEINNTYWKYILDNGLALNDVKYTYYTGMNLSQMATTSVRCITFYTYTLNGETITVYSAEKVQVLMDYLRLQSDEKSVAVVEAYELMLSVESNNVVVDNILLDSNYGPTFAISYDLKTITAKGSISYSAAQTKALSNYIAGLNGVITELNLAFTWDGTDPMTSTTGIVAKQEINNTYWDYMKRNGLALNDVKNGYYTGANFAQFDQEVKFIAFVTYTDSEGVSQRYYLGDIQTITFNSLIADDTSELAVAYKELYKTFVG